VFRSCCRGEDAWRFFRGGLRSSRVVFAIALAVLVVTPAGCSDSSPPGGGTGGTPGGSGTGGTPGGSGTGGTPGGPGTGGSSGGSGGSSGAQTGACGAVNGSCRFGSTCIESVAGAYPFAESMSSCVSEAAGATWSPTPCSHAGAVGGCRLTDGTRCAALWAYMGPVSSAMASCTNQGGTWLAP
jgi:hypothetical protein